MTGHALTKADSHAPNRLRLAVVDMVGTTITDDGRTERAMSRALVEHGIEPGSTRFESMLGYARDTMGFSKMTVFSHLFEDPAVAESANKVFEKAYDEIIEDGGVRAIPGAEDAILWMRESGMQVCLATGFGRHTQNMVLESLGWMGLADLSLCPPTPDAAALPGHDPDGGARIGPRRRAGGGSGGRHQLGHALGRSLRGLPGGRRADRLALEATLRAAGATASWIPSSSSRSWWRSAKPGTSST
jgi:hypothetical protein